MSIPISSNSAAALGAPVAQVTSSSTSQTNASQVNPLDAAAMLLPLLFAGTSSDNVNQFELSFEQTLQSATAVDPLTGQHVISASADSQLSAALNSLLTESGFSAQQADAASASLGEQLAKGGPISLNASFGGTSTNAFSVSAGYGTQTTSAVGVSVNERFGSVSIGFDPTTGDLSVSLENNQVGATASVTAPSVSGSNSLHVLQLPSVDTVTVVDSQILGIKEGDDAVKNNPELAAQANETTESSDSSIQFLGLIAGLGRPTLHHAQDALDLLSNVVKDEQARRVAATRADGTADDTQRPRAAQATAVKIGFTQPLSIARHNLKGHGTTLFRQVDGSTGAISFEPTNIEA